MMREFTGQKDMVRPAKTRVATAFITLNCFKANKRKLREMFTSSAWIKSKVLRLVDGERKPPTGYIYEAVDRAKKIIAASFKNKQEKYKEIFKIIDKRWNCQLHRPLHLAGYYLNPSLYYNNPDVEDDSEILGGLHSCIDKLALIEEVKSKIHLEIPLYRHAEGIFGTPFSKKMRATLAPGML
ncbi:uncharacterized protein LOC143572349 [Bidens hawaiensis]|uniref:uncharacterized protein LOC143572349 n=1 Tax=Bidens hawaiensis TaxID=980011 RepID=UPI004049E2FC